jgi:hypothetical protein
MTPDIKELLRLGLLNPWIAGAWDPPFTEASFHHCATADELRDRLANRNHEVGYALTYQDACFIQQATPGDESVSSNCGDEWLVIRHGCPFDSVTFHGIIREGLFYAVIAEFLAATPEECRRMTPDMYLRSAR